jgi:putative ABC transport system permease protein
MMRDLRFGLRLLRRHPSFAVAAIAVMALGVGATTAVFSVLRGVLIAPLPYREPGSLVLFRADLPGITHAPVLTSLEYHALRARTEVFASVAAAVYADGNITAGDVTVPANTAAVSENFLDTLGVPLALGRTAGGRENGRRTINIGFDAWQRHFRGDPAIVGAAIDVNGEQMQVNGVLPAGFRAYLGAGVRVPPNLDLVYFRSAGYDSDPFRGNVVIARLREGVGIDAARAAVDVVARSLAADHPDRYRTGPVRLSLARLDDEVVGGVKPALLAAAGAVLFVLLVACAALSNLLLARASARAREIALRISIGARRVDIVRQILIEGMILGTIGAAAGWLLAHWGVRGLLALAPAALPRREAIVMDGGIALAAIAIAGTCAVAVSLVPAWQATRSDVVRGMKRAQAGGTARGVLVAAQLAFSVVLLVGAGLMGRAFVNMRSMPLGFDPGRSASLFVSLGGPQDGRTIEESRTRRREFYERLLDGTRDLSGVESAGAGFPVPLTGIAMSQRVSLGEGTTQRETDGFIAFDGYLESLKVPLLAGRYFTRADHRQLVVIVDQHLAQELWPGDSAVGRRLMVVRSVSEPLWAEVVGVVAHVQSRGPRDAGPPQVWMTNAIRSYPQMNVVIRSRDPLGDAARTVKIVQQLNAGRPVRDIRRLAENVADATADTGFALFVLGVFAAVAVVLAAVGVYGVVAYAMARRTRELAVRLALGASPRRLVARVVGEGAVWTAAGLAAGLGGAALLARYLESLLFHVGPHDAPTFAAVAAFLALVTLAASAVPALRAARIDPMLALRGD